jgi:flavin reductase (DIM6/NTAB) family NADH-FMN oxidoreductase RutF
LIIQDSTGKPVIPLLHAIGKIPSGLFIITAGQGSHATGTLVSFVQQISIEPPYIGIAVRKDGALAQSLPKAGTFVINICHSGDKTLLRKYAKGTQEGEAAFSDVRTRRLDSGNIVLLDACSFIECELVNVLDFGGDHDLFIARARAGDLIGDPPGKPVVHIRHDGSKY